jgi:hypothetical protein
MVILQQKAIGGIQEMVMPLQQVVVYKKQDGDPQ